MPYLNIKPATTVRYTFPPINSIKLHSARQKQHAGSRYECSNSTEGKLADIYIKINNIVDKSRIKNVLVESNG
jgi:hypothetical protein